MSAISHAMSKFLSILTGAALVGAMATAAAQMTATRGIRLVVPSPPGSFNDTIARVLVQNFNEGFAPGSYTDNKPGAGTVIGTDFVAKSTPDGRTLLIVSFPFSVMGELYPGAKIDVLRDFVPVIHIGFTPSLLIVNTATPYRTVKDLVEAAKAKPDLILYGSTSNGSSGHLVMERFKSLTNTSLVHVPFKGSSEELTALIAGQVPVAFVNLPEGLPFVTSGRVRALGICAAKRYDVMPEVPTMAEAGFPGFEANIWFGIVAPAATPKDTVLKLNAEINRILATNDVRKLFRSREAQIVGGTPEAFADYLRSLVTGWGKVVRDSKIKAE
jgi:tripartite-type tricarboxylate transporter receptor subunit TctC